MPHKKEHKKKEHKKKERKPRKSHKKEPKTLYATLASVVGLGGAAALRSAAKSQKGQEYIAKGKQLALQYKDKMPALDLRVVGKGNAKKFWKFHKENIEHYIALHGGGKKAGKGFDELKKLYHLKKDTL